MKDKKKTRELRWFVDVLVEIPNSIFGSLSKKNLKRSDVTIIGVDWGNVRLKREIVKKPKSRKVE